jgi:hypothetical protein
MCDVLQNPRRFDNKLIAVRGIVKMVKGQPYKDAYLYKELLSPACIDKKTKREFAGTIKLFSPSEDMIANPPGRFNFDEESFRIMEKIFDQHGGHIQALVTIEGLIHVRHTNKRATAQEQEIPQIELTIQAIRDPVFLK